MSIPSKILLAAARRFAKPYHDIFHHGDLYMRRWWLLRDENARRAGKVTVGLHHIVRPDVDRDMHTHPATFISLVFWGWYKERLPLDQRQSSLVDEDAYRDVVRRAGSIAVRRASDRHCITEVAPEGAWTIVIWFRKQGSWGFWRVDNGEFVPWRKYTSRRDRGARE